MSTTEAVFDALGQIGLDRAAGPGVFANRTIRFEAPFLSALRDENAARGLLGLPELPKLAPDPIPTQPDPIMAQQAALIAHLAALRTS